MADSMEVILEERGHFWWHGEKTPKGRFVPPFGVPGILRIYADGRARLNVTRSLIQSPFLNLSREVLTSLDSDREALKSRSIAGRLDAGRCIYLKDLVYRSLGGTEDGKPSELFWSHFCIVGDTTHTRAQSALRFSKLSVSLAGLEEWTKSDVLVADAENTTTPVRSRNISYSIHPTKYNLREGTLSFRTDVHCSAWKSFRHRDISFRQYDWLDYVRNRQTTPEALRDEFTCVEEFLALLTGVYYSLDWPVISTIIGDKIETYTVYFLRNIEKKRTPEMRTIWANYPQVRENFAVLYATWKKKRREYGPGFYLFLGELRSGSMYIEHRFINLIWGIESLHRGMDVSTNGSKDQRKIVDSILTKAREHLNSKERGWLKLQRNRFSEPALDERIVSTFAPLPWKLTRKSLKEFADRCRYRRNQISHDGGPKDKTESHEKFFREINELTEGLVPLYHAVLLQEVGIGDQILVNCAKGPVGWDINAGLKVAKLEAENFIQPTQPDMASLLKEQEKIIRKWRRRNTKRFGTNVQ